MAGCHVFLCVPVSSSLEYGFQDKEGDFDLYLLQMLCFILCIRQLEQYIFVKKVGKGQKKVVQWGKKEGRENPELPKKAYSSMGRMCKPVISA